MTPKEKAEQLLKRYTIIIQYDFVSDLMYYPQNDELHNKRVKKDAKRCALTAIEFIIEQNIFLNKSSAFSFGVIV